MKQLGDFLKKLRHDHHYSLQQITAATGITNSQQSRIERGLNQNVSPLVLKKLAIFYDIDVINLYILAGFLTQDDLCNYTRTFKYAELLTDSQRKNIQEEINLFTQNGGNQNAI